MVRLSKLLSKLLRVSRLEACIVYTYATYGSRMSRCRVCGTPSVAHTGFSYGVGTVSSPGPYPEKAPPLFLFSSNLRYIIFQNDILITSCIPQKIFIRGRRSGPGAGPLRFVGEK